MLLLFKHLQAVAVAFTPLAASSKHYNIWYNVALKSKEYDTVGEICYAVVTSTDLAHDLGVESTPRAHLMLWNNTKVKNLNFVLTQAILCGNSLFKGIIEFLLLYYSRITTVMRL